jgi:molybdate transport system substrate-binding protein
MRDVDGAARLGRAMLQDLSAREGLRGAAMAWPMLVVLLFVSAAGCQRSTATNGGPLPSELSFAGRSIEAFVGSASKPATEEAARLFEQWTGARVVLHFGGSGQMLSQIKLAQRGDLYFPGSSDYMELAKREGLALADSERRVVYLIPAINVPKGNPKNIRTMADLARPDVRVGIARPDAVCVGLYAVEVMNQAGLDEQIRPRIATQAESCEKTAQLVALGSVDAVLGWRVFQYWEPDKIETILLPPEQVSRIGYIPIAKTPFVQDDELAQAFIDFLTGDEGQAVFRRWHYLTDVEEARAFALPDTPVGGEWVLPEGW